MATTTVAARIASARQRCMYFVSDSFSACLNNCRQDDIRLQRGHKTSCAHSSSLSIEARRKAQWHRTSKEAAYADSLQMHVKGGQGGDGCVSFAREKFKPFGPPSGANGGPGGSVQIRASLSVSTLARLPGQLVAGRGTHGTSDWQPGKRGHDKIFEVPVGTVVRVVPVQSSEEQDVRRREYEDALRHKYRNAYMRQRRVRLATRPYDERSMDNYSLDQQRAQRQAVWRYYAGAIGHDVSHSLSVRNAVVHDEESDCSVDDESATKATKGSGGEGKLDTRSEARFLLHEDDLSDAESDIRGLGRTFREAERRLAFSLLDRDAMAVDKPAEGKLWPSPEEHRSQTVTGSHEWSVDLDSETSQPLSIVYGGSGGLGNALFASSNNRSPTLATRGCAGDEAIVHLEWKFKGDVGLIGLPNAGKSTFLKAVCSTGENVRVADYAFTTLTPNIGVVRMSEQGLIGTSNGPVEESMPRDRSRRAIEGEGYDLAQLRDGQNKDGEEYSRFILQDLPGLVRGASEDRGLGHDFLKHVERCLALYYVVDVSDSSQTPWDDVQLVYRELEEYRGGLSRKVQGVIANKCDAIDVQERTSSHNQYDDATTSSVQRRRDALEKLSRLRREVASLHGRPIPVWNVSAKYRIGVEQTAWAMDDAVRAARESYELMSCEGE